MESPSFVSKVRIAFHSAAAKTERVFSDIKPDRDSPRSSINQADDESPKNEGESKGSHESKHLRWRPPNIGTKQDWQDKLRNIGKGKKGAEDTEKGEYSTMAVPFYDENLYLLNMKTDIEAKGHMKVAMRSPSHIVKAHSQRKATHPNPSSAQPSRPRCQQSKLLKSLALCDFLTATPDTTTHLHHHLHKPKHPPPVTTTPKRNIIIIII